MKPDSLIHLRVPAATKGRWVRASRAAGMRLTDWIVDAVEAHMQQQAAKVAIPKEISNEKCYGKVKKQPPDLTAGEFNRRE